MKYKLTVRLVNGSQVAIREVPEDEIESVLKELSKIPSMCRVLREPSSFVGNIIYTQHIVGITIEEEEETDG